MRKWIVAFLALACFVIAPGRVSAQQSDTDAAKIQVARKLYDEGVDAVKQSRWSVAYDKFKASHELAPRVLTLMNLAGAEQNTNRFVEASESFRRFLRETSDGRYPELRASATAALESIEKQIAQMTLKVTNLDPSDAVKVDESDFPQSALGEPFPMNPGSHAVWVVRGGAKLGTKTFALTAGAAETVTVDLNKKVEPQAPLTTATSDTLTGTNFSAAPPAEKTKGSILRSPWLWVGVGAVVVAGGVTAYYLSTRSTADAVVR
jgi:hypothetical protein